jgi:hypothetical protein
MLKKKTSGGGGALGLVAIFALFALGLDSSSGGSSGSSGTSTDPTTGLSALFVSSVQGLIALFTPTVIGGTSPYNYFWNFGDSNATINTDIAQNPSHTFSGPGTYNVTLTVTDASGIAVIVSAAVNLVSAITPTINLPTVPRFLGNMSGIPLNLPGFLTAILDPLRTSPIYLANEGIISTNVSDDPINYPIFTQYGNTNEMQLKSAQDELNALNDPTNPITKWILSGGATPAQFQAYKDQYIAKVAALKHKISLEWNLGYEMPHYIPPPDVFIP